MEVIDYAGGMKLIYHDNHATRHAHISERFRWKYPDEIVLGPFGGHVKRTKPFNELIWEDVPDGLSPSLVANDRPFTDGCIKA